MCQRVMEQAETNTSYFDVQYSRARGNNSSAIPGRVQYALRHKVEQIKGGKTASDIGRPPCR